MHIESLSKGGDGGIVHPMLTLGDCGYDALGPDGQWDGTSRRTFVGFLVTHTPLHLGSSVAVLGEDNFAGFSCASPQWVELIEPSEDLAHHEEDWRDGDRLSRLVPVPHAVPAYRPVVRRRLEPLAPDTVTPWLQHFETWWEAEAPLLSRRFKNLMVRVVLCFLSE